METENIGKVKSEIGPEITIKSKASDHFLYTRQTKPSPSSIQKIRIAKQKLLSHHPILVKNHATSKLKSSASHPAKMIFNMSISAELATCNMRKVKSEIGQEITVKSKASEHVVYT